MKYGKKRKAWGISLDYDGKHEILLGLIFEYKRDAIGYFKETLYSPNYKIVRLEIKER